MNEDAEKNVVEVDIDFDAWAEEWLKGLLASPEPALNVTELASLLRRAFERNVPDAHIEVRVMGKEI